VTPPTAAPGASGSADRLTARGSLSAAEYGAILQLVSAAAGADGVQPVSEQVILHVQGGGSPRAVNLLLWAGGTLAGYAHLDPGEAAPDGDRQEDAAGNHQEDGQEEEPGGELVVGPAFRGRGRGRALAAALTDRAGGHPFRLWAHGDLPAARRLAAAAGFDRDRALWQMRRPLAAPLPGAALPDRVTVRAFVPGRDEGPWLELNRRAFAAHPEQGSWTREDLDQREREPWFDPAGFFLAERRGKLAGFHWTKIHPAGETAGPSPPGDGEGGAEPSAPIGEVYVVGVDPAEQGTGLGRALTLTGLAYLRARGLAEVLLYVDESNAPAVKLYESLGFVLFSTDVMYRWPGHGPAGKGA
jgi:mycothiol synthase